MLSVERLRKVEEPVFRLVVGFLGGLNYTVEFPGVGRGLPLVLPQGASRPGAIEHWTVEQWTILKLRSTSLLSISHTDPLLQFPMLQGAKRLPGPLRPNPAMRRGERRSPWQNCSW